MSKHPTPFPKTATFLSTETNQLQSDPPIPIDRAAEVWRDFEPVARSVVVASLRKLPLARLRDRLDRAGVPIRRSLQTVRERLSTDEELLADLVQEVALAFVVSVKRLKLRAARPQIYAWVQVTAARIAREKSRAEATSVLTGAHLSAEEREATDVPCARQAIPKACVVGRALGDGEGPEELYAVRTELRELLFAAVPANLTDAQQVVFTRWVEGASHEDIARELGISEVAVRLRLLHARRRLAS